MAFHFRSQARYEALVTWEVNELECYAGAPSYLRREECTIGIIESFFIVHRGATVSLMDSARRGAISAANIADFFNTVGRR